jgi:hypothetical protein
MSYGRFILTGLLFVGLPLLLVEGGVRALSSGPLSGLDLLVNFYRPVAAHVDTAHVDILLVGSSRVAAAVDASSFAKVVESHTGRRPHVLNVGQGYSTPVVHYLALNDLLKQHPERFRGATVLVEAPAGRPDPGTWQREWAHPEWPTLLSPYLSPAQLPGFWRYSQNDLSTKTLVTAASLLKSVRYWKFIRAKAQDLPSRITSRFVHSAPPAAASPEGDLTTAGGIRTDSAGIALARRQALEAAQSSPALSSVASVDWESTVWAELQARLDAVGARIAFFEVPLSSVDRSALSDEVNTPPFTNWRDSEGIPLYAPSLRLPDSAFPDLIHLAASQAPAYTHALAATYLSSPASLSSPNRSPSTP